ncbi:MAG: S9 family peptidase [Anaerolineales bacterium]|nr:S9 family peptidase [Anaerolineales bacterium]
MVYSLPTQTTLLAKAGACWAPVFSPDGTQLAFLSDLSGLPQVWRVPVCGGWPTPITVLDDPVSKVVWSPAGEWLAFGVAPAGGMNEQIFIVRPDGSDLRCLTNGGNEINFLANWLSDGKTLTYFSNRRSPEKMDLYQYDISSDHPQLITHDVGDGLFADFHQASGLALLVRRLNRCDEELLLLDLIHGREHQLIPHQDIAQFPQARFSPDGKNILLATNLGRDRTAFARLPLATDIDLNQLEILYEREDADLQTFDVHTDKHSVVMMWNVNGRSELEWVSLEGRQEPKHLPTPADIITQIKISPDGKHVVIAATGSNLPENIYLLALDNEQISPISASPHAGIRLQSLIQPELVTYSSHDGYELSGWLYIPRTFSPPGPLVLCFHGGPEAQELPAFNSTYQALLCAGIAVMAPNIRGSSGYGKVFMNWDNGINRLNTLRDIQSSAEFICKEGYTNPQCLGIMGASYGGYLTVSGLALYPQLFNAGVTISGFVNFETFFTYTEPWIAAISKLKYGDPKTDRQMLRKLSPIHWAQKIEAPLLILHGENDRNVPLSEPDQLSRMLYKKNVTFNQYIFPNEGHQFKQVSTRVKTNEAIVNWFRHYLKH